MQGIRKHLLQAQHDLRGKCEPASELIDRLRSEGKVWKKLSKHY